MTTILGIDPGSNITGYGIIQSQGARQQLISCGRLILKGEQLSHRLEQLSNDLEVLVQTYQPELAAIERVFMSRYPDAALKLGQARGVAVVTLARAGLAISEYAPREAKQAIVGYGGADKHQMRQMVTQLLRLDQAPSADAADALAIGLCHAQCMNNTFTRRAIL